MPKVIRQSVSPYPFTKGVLGADSWKVVQTHLSNEITVLRYLTSKIVFTEEILTLEEISILFVAFEELVKKSSRDKFYRQKYLVETFLFRQVYQSLENLLRKDPKQRCEQLSKNYSFYRGKLFSARYFYAVRGQVQRLFEIRLKTRFPKKFAPKTFIGKGYGDHGTAKEPAYDGCLTWQEVAGAKLWTEVDAPTVLDIEIGIFQNFKVHQAQLLK